MSCDEGEDVRLRLGVSILTDATGQAIPRRAGAGFVIRPGFSGTWEVLDATLKEYVIVSSGERKPHSASDDLTKELGICMKKLSLGLAIALIGALPALAQNVIAENPGQMADVLRSFGFRAELATDTGGDPKIASSSGGANFSIFFYGCTNGTNCDAISFSAAFDLDPGSNTNLMNQWNHKKRYSKAYLDDEQDPVIDMDVYLGNGGVSIDNFRFWVDTWERALGDFKVHIDF